MREVLLLCWRDSGHPQGGGSERYLEQIAEGLAAQGVRVTYRTSGYPGAPRSERTHGFRISRGGGRLTVYPRALGAILAGRLGFGPLKGVRPDAVIDTQNGVPFFARLVAGAPVAVLVHHCHREQWPVAGKALGHLGWFIESKLSPLLHRRNQYVTVSLPSAEELTELGIENHRIAVVRNGADPTPEGIVDVPAADPTIVVLSRLVPHKQIEDALAVVARLRERFPRLHLDVVGGGWWDGHLRAEALRLGIADAVTFHGHVDEQRKHELLSAAWLQVLPSRKEGWALTVIEAAQHGVPTIGYRHSGGLTDSIVDGVTGVLVGDDAPADGDLDALTAATAELLADAEARAVMGEKARARAAAFSWDQAAAGMSTVLHAMSQGRFASGILPRES